MATTIQPPTPVAATPRPQSVPGTGWPRPHRWTLQEYRKLAQFGLLDGLRTILIDGEVLAMPQPDPPHDTTLTLVYEFLRAICPDGHYVRNQQSFDVGLDNDPGPDITIVPGSVRDYTTQAPRKALLVVEVAVSSLPLDTTSKAELYATAGVPEYWVIDLKHRQLIVFRDPQTLPAGLGATAYRTHFTLSPTDRVSPLAVPVASILISDLLP